MPLRDNSYLDQPMTFQAKNFQLPLDQSVQPQQPQQPKQIQSEGIGGWLQRQLFRNGGLRPGRDNAQITSFAQMIASGQMPEQQAMELRQKNPDSDAIFAQAQAERQQRVQLSQELAKFQKPEGFDYSGASRQMFQIGRPDIAQKLMQEGVAQSQASFMRDYKLMDLQSRIQAHQDTLENQKLTREERKIYQDELLSLRKQQMALTSDPWGGWGSPGSNIPGQPGTTKPPETFDQVPEGLQVAAWEQFQGRNPSFGLGAKPRVQLYTAVSLLGKKLGLSPAETASGIITNASRTKALDNIVKWGAGVARGEQTVKLNAKLALDAAKKIYAKYPSAKMQAINKAILAGRRQFNDPDVNAYAVYVSTIQNEYTRVMTAPMSNARLAEGATARGQALVNAGADPQALSAVFDAMGNDMNNQSAATEQTAQQLREGMMAGNKPVVPQPTDSNMVNWDTLK